MGENIEMNQTEKKELALSKIVLVTLTLVGLAIIIWLAWIMPGRKDRGINSYEACVKAGNEILLSYPSTCQTKSGKHFTNPNEKVDQAPH